LAGNGTELKDFEDWRIGKVDCEGDSVVFQYKVFRALNGW
jgi:hypothetical protein